MRIYKQQNGQHSTGTAKGLCWKAYMPEDMAEQLEITVETAAQYVSQSGADDSLYMKCQLLSQITLPKSPGSSPTQKLSPDNNLYFQHQPTITPTL